MALAEGLTSTCRRFCCNCRGAHSKGVWVSACLCVREECSNRPSCQRMHASSIMWLSALLSLLSYKPSTNHLNLSFMTHDSPQIWSACPRPLCPSLYVILCTLCVDCRCASLKPFQAPRKQGTLLGLQAQAACIRRVGKCVVSAAQREKVCLMVRACLTCKSCVEAVI